MPTCKHPNWELFEDADTKGLWGLCSDCEAHTAIFHGEKAAKTVASAMKRMKRERPRNPKKAHKGAGRPRELPRDAKARIHTLCDSHVQRLERYKKKHQLRNRSEALRHWIENQPI